MDVSHNGRSHLGVGKDGQLVMFAYEGLIKSLDEIWDCFTGGNNDFYTYVFRVRGIDCIPIWADYDSEGRLAVLGAATWEHARELFKDDYDTLRSDDRHAIFKVVTKIRATRPKMIRIECNRFYQYFQPTGKPVLTEPVFDADIYPGVCLFKLDSFHDKFVIEDVVAEVNAILDKRGVNFKRAFSIKPRGGRTKGL